MSEFKPLYCIFAASDEKIKTQTYKLTIHSKPNGHELTIEKKKKEELKLDARKTTNCMQYIPYE